MPHLKFLPSIQQLMGDYNREGRPHLRLGQYFCNEYVKYSWPELYYEEDNRKAIRMITTYLTHYQYENELPAKVIRK